jgi:hypothetical protein
VLNNAAVVNLGEDFGEHPGSMILGQFKAECQEILI